MFYHGLPLLSRLVKGSPFRMLLSICHSGQVFGDAVSNIAILVLILSQGILTFSRSYDQALC